MTISIERTRTYHDERYPEVGVEYKVPTAEDFERLLSDKPGDCEVFKTFALKVTGLTDESGQTYKAEDIPQLPGTWLLVSGVAKAVLESATLGLDGKNV